MEHKDSWKNINVFKKQLSLNQEEFNNYPLHWKSFIKLINVIFKNESKINLLDIGCGCGSYYKLCKDNFSNISYYGIDYSSEAISIANEQWKVQNFETMDLFDIDINFISKFNVLHLGALLDVLHNGNYALEFILKKQIPYILIGRIDFTNKNSGSYEYKAYDEIITYKYEHNIDEFKQIVSNFNYKIIEIDHNSILLQYEKGNNNGNIGPRWIISN